MPNLSPVQPSILHPIHVPLHPQAQPEQPQHPIHVTVPVNVVADAKKEKSPPAGAFLYGDIYNGFRLVEQLYLATSSPVAPLAWTVGALVGSKIAFEKIYKVDAPLKIEQDAAVIDFGARVHSTGFIDLAYMLFKKFTFGTLPMAHFDLLPRYLPESSLNNVDLQHLSDSCWMVKHACIAVKAASFATEVIERAAHWYSVVPQNK